MQPSQQSPEYQALFRRAEQTECTCEGKSKNLTDTAWRGCIKCCTKFIIQVGGQLSLGETALMASVEKGHLEISKLLIPHEAKIQRKDGRTALMKSTNYDHPEVTKLLIPYEAQMQDKDGKTALVHAIGARHVEIAKELLPYEADIADSVCKTPADYAFRTDCAELWRIFDKDITEEKIILLQAAHKTQCRCGTKSTSLIEAAGAGCVKCCALFIKETGRLVDGTTTLIKAVKKAHLEVVKLLIPFEAKMQNNEGWTALIYSARGGHIEIARLLIHHEAKMQSNYGWAALIFAVYNGHLEIVELLIPHEAKIQDKDGKTALMRAVEINYSEIAKFLIPHEAGIRSNLGKTALHFAVMRNQVEIAELLLPLEGHLADIGGKIPADYAGDASQEMRALFARHGPVAQRSEPFKPVSKCSGKTTNLIEAASEGCVECVRKCIGEAGKLVDDRTALMEAAIYGHLEIIKVLIPHEAKIQDKDGKTALMLSAWQGHLEIAQLLAPQEATVQNQDGMTALMKAAFQGHPEVTKLLIPYEAGIKDNKDETATILAIREYQLECIRLLLENEAERQESDITPAMMAAYRGDIRALLGCKSEWHVKCLQRTVLDFALLGRQRRAIRLLTSTKWLQQFFARETMLKALEDNGKMICFLSNHKSLIQGILPVFCVFEATYRLELFLESLCVQPGVSRYLRPFYTPTAGWIEWYFKNRYNETKLINAMKNLKHVGFSSKRRIITDFAEGHKKCVSDYLEASPLKQKQVKLSMREGQRYVPDDKQIAQREVEAESIFNRALLFESRCFIQNVSPAFKLIHDSNTNHIEHKQSRINLLLVASYQFMFRVVQEMIDE